MTVPTSSRVLSGFVRNPLCLLAAVSAAAAGGVALSGSNQPTSAGDPTDPACYHAAAGELGRYIPQYCADSPHPAARAANLITLLERSSMCFSKKITPEAAFRVFNILEMRPPGLIGDAYGPSDDLRFRSDSPVWTGAGLQSASLRAQPATLTYSFPIDGTAWDGGSNVLTARLSTGFGATNIDRGHELIRQAFAGWRRDCGLTYTQVADDNTGFTNSTTHVTTRGDIRIGARPQDGAFNVLAYNYFPDGGSDMVLDADDFSGSSFLASGNNYRYFRNTVAHEHGHGLGYIHTVPCNDTKLMEPQLSTSFEPLPADDTRGAQRNYGDRYADNTTAALAKDFGNLTSPIVKSIIEKNLSTNGTGGFDSSNQDWFKFMIGSVQNVVITVDPTGGSYTEGQQSSGCTGTTATVNADQAGNLAVELRDAAGTSILLSSSGAAAGVSEVITANSLAAGTYTVRVVDNGPNAAANQVLQTYDMTIRVGTSKAPPEANAGVNKRIAANTTCWFMGNINSRVTEAGATITTYAWDLDGDGTFEVANNAQPTRSYPINGVYTATLRVTDSNGMTDTDSILVTVFGGTSGVTVTSVAPNSGVTGTTVPVTINGTALNNVNASTDVTVSGTGVTVIGTPVPNGAGTQVTGLSFQIAAGATLGARNVTVTTEDGTGTGTNAFTVNANVAPVLATITPDFVRQGFTVPVSMTGINLNAVTSASQVTTSGTGITVIGTPSAPGGSPLTGLSFQVAPDAPSGSIFRSVTLTTPSGNSTLFAAFRVRCLADWDGDFQVTPSDVANFINNWSADLSNGTLHADINQDLGISPSDVAAFINLWFEALSNGCV